MPITASPLDRGGRVLSLQRGCHSGQSLLAPSLLPRWSLGWGPLLRPLGVGLPQRHLDPMRLFPRH